MKDEQCLLIVADCHHHKLAELLKRKKLFMYQQSFRHARHHGSRPEECQEGKGYQAEQTAKIDDLLIWGTLHLKTPWRQSSSLRAPLHSSMGCGFGGICQKDVNYMPVSNYLPTCSPCAYLRSVDFVRVVAQDRKALNLLEGLIAWPCEKKELWSTHMNYFHFLIADFQVEILKIEARNYCQESDEALSSRHARIQCIL